MVHTEADGLPQGLADIVILIMEEVPAVAPDIDREAIYNLRPNPYRGGRICRTTARYYGRHDLAPTKLAFSAATYVRGERMIGFAGPTYVCDLVEVGVKVKVARRLGIRLAWRCAEPVPLVSELFGDQIRMFATPAHPVHCLEVFFQLRVDYHSKSQVRYLDVY